MIGRVTPSKLVAAKTLPKIMVNGSEICEEHTFEQEGKILT